MSASVNPSAGLRADLRRSLNDLRHGRTGRAARRLEKLRKRHGPVAELLNVQGLVHLQSGQPQRALRMIDEGLRRKPNDGQALYNSGMALVAMRRWREAAVRFERAMRAGLANADALNALGNARRLAGDAAGALEPLQRAVELAPTLPDVLANLAAAQLELGRLADCEATLKRVFECAPTHHSGVNLRARLLLRRDQPQAAAELLQTHLHNAPPSAETLNNLAVAVTRTGDVDGGAEHLRGAVALDSKHGEAHLNLGIASEQLGSPKVAEKHLKRAAKLRPKSGRTLYHLLQLRGYEPTTGEREAMRAIADAAELPVEERAFALFALGRAEERAQRFEAAFAAWKAAHGLRAGAKPYDERAAQALFDGLMAVAPTASGGQGEGLVFVLGMPRSGTTLAEQVLAAHSATVTLGEQPFAGLARRALEIATKQPYPACLQASAALVDKTRAQWLSKLPDQTAPVTHIVETTPGNFLNIGLIAQLFPRARFVHCRRDARDTCLSIYQHPLSRAHDYADDLTALGRYYRRYLGLMAHWHRALPHRIYDIEYESLVQRPEPEIKALLSFLGLPYEPECLEFHAVRRAVRTPSASQVRMPMYVSSIGRWRCYEHQLGPLLAVLAEQH